MQLPVTLRRAIERELAVCDTAKLRAASEQLSECYRERDKDRTAVSRALSGVLSNADQRAAYLAVRLPATYAAVVQALEWARESFRGDIESVLDLGSGPGTALWAAAQIFPTLHSATGFERDPKLIEIARSLTAEVERSVLCETQWLQGDLTVGIPEGAWDLVVCSYALNELKEVQRVELVRKAWSRTAKLLVVVEPGTKVGFANILAVRTRLLAEGATLAAPCPNSLACPMAGRNDWCHFAARVERTAEHRRLKNAVLGHEDEKFSYVAFFRDALLRDALLCDPISPSPIPQSSIPGEPQSPPARIVRHPKIFSGYTQITLCREGQIADTTITRSKKDDWRRLKRLGWGDRW
jgi:ribosomal protein RSM22 (predicted rRNA methylase)